MISSQNVTEVEIETDSYIVDKVKEFHDNGFCVLENFFPNENYEILQQRCLHNFYEIQEIIREKGLEFGVGLKKGYDEIVQRHPGRYEVTYQMKNIFQSMSRNLTLLKVIHGILGEDVVIPNESLLISESGAPDQSWHADGPHMSVNEYLPCHVLNVFIPLIDITDEEGPTEFRPQSQHLTLDLKRMYLKAFMTKSLQSPVKPHLKKGSILLFHKFDYRILHRGTANRTTLPRPVYVLTFAKSWYGDRDRLNYPNRSVFTVKPPAPPADPPSLEVGEENQLQSEDQRGDEITRTETS